MRTYEPVGKRILLRWDDAKNETKGGIVLPDSVKIEVITGVVIEVSNEIQKDWSDKWPFQEGDRVLFYPSGAIPTDLEAEARKENNLYIVEASNVLAIVRDNEGNNGNGNLSDSDLDKLFNGTDQINESEEDV